ncbi:hypothetical protein Hanom_Chr12g01101431 [Helianthus anomalus]
MWCCRLNKIKQLRRYHTMLRRQNSSGTRENCLPTVLQLARICEQQNVCRCCWKCTFGNH